MENIIIQAKYLLFIAYEFVILIFQLLSSWNYELATLFEGNKIGTCNRPCENPKLQPDSLTWKYR